MVRQFLFGNTSNVLLARMMDKAAVSQRVIASNIANAGTPGYRRLGVSFDDIMRRAVAADRTIRRTDSRHLPDPNWQETITPEVALVEDDHWNGINNIDVDREMTDLAKNQLDFAIATRLTSMRYTQLRTAIRGGR